MELGECSLTNFIDSREDKSLTEPELVKLLKDVAAGIAYIHSNNVIHRDIKIDNVILKHDVYKITDFGVSAVGQFSQTFVGTPVYLAPEVMSNRVFNDLYDKSVDIWALGVLAFEAYFRVNPFFFHGSKLMSQKDFEAILDNILTVCTPQFDIKNVILKLKQEGKRSEAEFILEKLQKTSKHLMYLFQKIFEFTPESRIKIDSILQLLNVMEQPDLIKKAHHNDQKATYYSDPALESIKKPEGHIQRAMSVQTTHNVQGVLQAGYQSMLSQRPQQQQPQAVRSYVGYNANGNVPSGGSVVLQQEPWVGQPAQQFQKQQPLFQSQPQAQDPVTPALRHTVSMGPPQSKPRPSIQDELSFLNLARRLLSELYIERIHLIRAVVGAVEGLICFRREELGEAAPMTEFLYPGEIEKYKTMDILNRRITIRTVLYNHYKEMLAALGGLNQQPYNECMFRLLVCSALAEIVYNIELFMAHFKAFQGKKATLREVSQYAPYATVDDLRAFEAYITKCFFI